MNMAHKTLALLVLVAAGLGCGYSKQKTIMPAIMELSPASMTAGSAQFQLEVDGANLPPMRSSTSMARPRPQLS